jgi:DNA-binding transcriptional ArsR family regulator
LIGCIGGYTGGLTIGCIDRELKNLSDISGDEALVIVKLREDISGLTAPQLVRFFRKFYEHLSKQALIKRVHRALDKLEEKGLVITEVVGSIRFARLTKQGVLSVPVAVDLIKSYVCTKPTLEKVVEDHVSVHRLMEVMPNYRASQEWWEISRKLLPKPPAEYTKFDKEVLALTFEAWKDEVKRKVLVFVDDEGEFVYLPYITRFTSEEYARLLLAKYNHAWNEAAKKFDVGVFVTITLPPIFPLLIQRYAMSYLWHRLKSHLRKKYGDDLLILDSEPRRRSPPHIYGDEPQDALGYHRHAIIFGITRIMDKREFTLWLDKHLTNFLSRMGHHVRTTVNNRLTDEQVKWLNKFGKKLLKKYVKYKRKRKEYKGPVNWLTQIKRKEFETEDGRTIYYWEFTNPPPDYLKFLEERAKQTKLSCDGASPSPVDYVKKYLVKNLFEIVNGEDFVDRSDLSDDVPSKPPPITLDSNERDEGKTDYRRKIRWKKKHKLAWYWLVRARFFSVSPMFRLKVKKKTRKQRLEFVGSFKYDQALQLEVLS